jgi:hypothetical protein
MRRHAFKRQYVVGRKAQDAFGFDSAGQLGGCAQHLFQGFGSLVICYQDDDRRLRGASKERQVERAGRSRQTGHTSAPGTKAEMPSHTLKTRGLLQARESFADKGEDHSDSILQGAV